jgi:hypothetical protein
MPHIQCGRHGEGKRVVVRGRKLISQQTMSRPRYLGGMQSQIWQRRLCDKSQSFFRTKTCAGSPHNCPIICSPLPLLGQSIVCHTQPLSLSVKSNPCLPYSPCLFCVSLFCARTPSKLPIITASACWFDLQMTVHVWWERNRFNRIWRCSEFPTPQIHVLLNLRMPHMLSLYTSRWNTLATRASQCNAGLFPTACPSYREIPPKWIISLA